MLTEAMQTQLNTAEAKALATTGPHGVNVVPVSVITVSPNQIVLYDFFMEKSVENLRAEPTVGLSAWTGLNGVQVKATAEYVTTGEQFTEAEVAMKQQFPERTFKGIIVLSPTAVYDISAGANAGMQLL